MSARSGKPVANDFSDQTALADAEAIHKAHTHRHRDAYEWTTLRAPFPADDIEWRVARSGVGQGGKVWAQVLAYITNRAVMDRLDDVFGPANWRNEYTTGPGGGITCGLSVRLGDEWVTKWDGAEETDVEKIKGGLSAAMKRAAVQWGIGRYLYDLPDGWAQISDNGEHRDRAKQKGGADVPFRWDPPKLPAWALPKARSTRGPTAAPPVALDDSEDVTSPPPVPAPKKAASMPTRGDVLDADVRALLRTYSALSSARTLKVTDQSVSKRKSDFSPEQLGTLRLASQNARKRLARPAASERCTHDETERDPDGNSVCLACDLIVTAAGPGQRALGDDDVPEGFGP